MVRELPLGDHTPSAFMVQEPTAAASLKRLVRRVCYPPILAVRSGRLARRYSTSNFAPDRWLLGQRGNDYEAHRRRVEKFQTVRGARVLVAGCGTGNDIPSWARLQPREILGVDWFDYKQAWDLVRSFEARQNPAVELRFLQSDLANMYEVPGGSMDLVVSDAVFEHLTDLPDVLGEFLRILRPGGLVYATFGPLWYGFAGDHVSGFDDVLHGYNHLLLDHASWEEYLTGLGDFEHSEHDGRTWIKEDLFSRLRPREYLSELEASGLERLFVQAIVDPRALSFLAKSPFAEKLRAEQGELDLIISGMTIIYRKAW